MHDDKLSTLQEAALAELMHGEQIIWSAMPLAGARVRANLGACISGIIFTAFSIIWVNAVVYTHSQQAYINRGSSWLIAVFSIIFFWMGGTNMLAPLWAWRTARRTLYVITNRRAFIIIIGRKRIVRTFSNNMPVTVIKWMDGQGGGDIIFQREQFNGARGVTSYRDIGFLGLADVENVAQLLKSNRLIYPNDSPISELLER